jgi:hypothetical protein
MSGDRVRADLTFFDDPAIDRVLAMLGELAADLARERYRRRALEQRLAEAGVVDPSAIDALAGDPEFLAGARAEEAAAIERLLAPWLRDDSPIHPLRTVGPSAEDDEARPE